MVSAATTYSAGPRAIWGKPAAASSEIPPRGTARYHQKYPAPTTTYPSQTTTAAAVASASALLLARHIIRAPTTTVGAHNKVSSERSATSPRRERRPSGIGDSQSHQ